MRTTGYIEQTTNVEELVSEHLALVRKIAWHVHGRVASVVEIDDLVQVGYTGLVMAAQNYTIREGASFASYAGIRIKGTILDHLRKNSNLCRSTMKMMQLTKKTEERLMQQLGRNPTTEELAKAMDMTIAEIEEWQQSFQANIHSSIDEVYDEYSIWFTSTANTPEDNLNEVQLQAQLKNALKTLPEREAMVIQLYYVEELNVYEIAEVLEISNGRVSQIKKSAIEKLRHFIAKDQNLTLPR